MGILQSAVESSGRIRAEQPAVIARDGTRRWGQLPAEVERRAVELRAFGSASRIMLLLPSDGTALALLPACEVLGYDVVLLPPSFDVSDARKVMPALDVSHLFAVEADRLVCLARSEVQPAPSTHSIFLFTSGSTGQPRCARHGWESLTAGIRTSPHYAGARWFPGFAITSYSGLQVLLQAMLSGGTLVMPGDYTAASGLRALVEHGVEYLSCTPTYLRSLLLQSQPADWAAMRLRHVRLAGEIVDQQLLDRFRAHAPSTGITHIYGSTELGALISVHDGKAGFATSLVDGERLAIIDGELCARRRATAMSGYVKLSGTPDGGTALEPLGEWFHTGDLVERIGDRVYFLGRVDDVINVAGLKVSPARVEEVIRGVEDVLGVLVMGQRSSIAGNLVKALLWIRPGAEPEAVAAAVRHACARVLPEPMVPRLFEFTDGFEISAALKTRRKRPA